MNSTKHCPNCKQVLPLTAFHKNRARPDGHGVLCKRCKVRYDSAWRKNELVRLRAAVASLTAERTRLRQVITDLLTSADCTWEERGMGHDWAEAVAEARAALTEVYDE